MDLTLTSSSLLLSFEALRVLTENVSVDFAVGISWSEGLLEPNFPVIGK